MAMQISMRRHRGMLCDFCLKHRPVRVDILQEEIEKVRKRQAEREAEKARREEELVRTLPIPLSAHFGPYGRSQLNPAVGSYS